MVLDCTRAGHRRVSVVPTPPHRLGKRSSRRTERDEVLWLGELAEVRLARHASLESCAGLDRAECFCREHWFARRKRKRGAASTSTRSRTGQTGLSRRALYRSLAGTTSAQSPNDGAEDVDSRKPEDNKKTLRATNRVLNGLDSLTQSCERPHADLAPFPDLADGETGLLRQLEEAFVAFCSSLVGNEGAV